MPRKMRQKTKIKVAKKGITKKVSLWCDILGGLSIFLLATVFCLTLHQMNIDLKNSLNNMSLSCVNCNSLNMSKMGTEKQKIKLYGIVSNRSDIILLSDIRLGNNQGGSCAHELEKLQFSRRGQTTKATFSLSRPELTVIKLYLGQYMGQIGLTKPFLQI